MPQTRATYPRHLRQPLLGNPTLNPGNLQPPANSFNYISFKVAFHD
ncbi:hypothetical protein OAF99_00490 [Akkermansiaceae bacterium]|nr:hypothetical protein [bacterium]MDB4623862.1 hypothetical protein [Akkermansiaceae bacterium]MDB4758798.1 hypothetical protein [Akkermansiaceae bacterium]